MAFFKRKRGKTSNKRLKIQKEEIKSKFGIWYRLEFNDKKKEVRVFCMSAVGACSFLKQEIYYAMNPLKLKIVTVGLEDITYKCPSRMKTKVIERIKEC